MLTLSFTKREEAKLKRALQDANFGTMIDLHCLIIEKVKAAKTQYDNKETKRARRTN
jgi:hypothetical protein